MKVAIKFQCCQKCDFGFFCVCKSSEQKPLSEDVEYVTYHKPLPLPLHGYVWPFILLYSLVLFGWLWLYGPSEHVEGFLIGCAVVGALNIVTCLFCVWSIHIRCKLTCLKVSGTILF